MGLVGRCKEKKPLEKTGVDGKKISKQILTKCDVIVLTASICLRMGIKGWLL